MKSAAMRVKALALISRCRTCLVGSLDASGYPAIRAFLEPRKHDAMNTLYFSTNTSSHHVQEFRDNPKASVYFYDAQLFQGLLLRGRMEVTTRQELRDNLWREGDNVYYMLGPTDPDYSAMVFTAGNGRWYEDFLSQDFSF